MKIKKIFPLILILFPIFTLANQLPKNFVYLKEVAPSIVQDMRYATDHNFIGRPIQGYQSGECILTRQAAEALAKVQASLLQSNLSLKVYDCYRPQRAVNDFITWSQNSNDTKMKNEFYPKVSKSELFTQGYVAKQSGHSRGSTVDLTIVPLPTPKEAVYRPGQALIACFAPYHQRYRDNSIDMGTGYDCCDSLSHTYNPRVPLVAYENRRMLRHIMQKYGFEPYAYEWWHFTLKNEPYPNTYFDFPVQ